MLLVHEPGKGTAMNHAYSIELAAQAVLRLARRKAALISCVEGVIWITCDGDPTDVILEAGASRRFAHGGLVVQAMRPARIVVYAPLSPFFANDDRPTPARISAIPAK